MARPPAPPLPDPALVVLVGPAGSGKSHFAEAHFRGAEIVSSDELRGIVGSGAHDLSASEEAFALLERIVAGRLSRRLTTVVDTLGFDRSRRAAWLQAARDAELPAVAVVIDTPPEETRRRNADRSYVVPAPALTTQLRRFREVRHELDDEGWDLVHVVTPDHTPAAQATVSRVPRTYDDRRSSQGLEIVLQLSRFPWAEDPAGWLRSMALAADQARFTGIAVMDHLIQIPQVDRAWEPIPEPWVTLGLVAGLDTRLRLGTLCTPVTFRPAGITAKAAATLDALTGGRTFVGVGAGWWEREHAAYGLPFPSSRERLDALESAIETMRALWAPGTKAYAGERVDLPETTSYPRPDRTIPLIVGGSGEMRTLAIAARLGDGCNLPSDTDRLDHKLAVLRQHLDAVGRPHEDLAVTVLDLPVIGRDRDDVWARVERHRGRTNAAAYAARKHAGTVPQQRDRYAGLVERGVRTVFLSTPDLDGPDDVLALSGLMA
jgi:alkanesulfonate monooxygenase SsuD/methylene tetrahydromethanopterin reductase-like flavin-dependent oxidoreductase (luciferase family)/predicted kinase